MQVAPNADAQRQFAAKSRPFRLLRPGAASSTRNGWNMGRAPCLMRQ